MNAPVQLDRLLPQMDHSHLDWLEEEAIFILREVAATSNARRCCFPAARIRAWCCGWPRRPSSARKATADFSGRLPFPLLHVDTGHNFPEVIEFRDQRVAEMGERLVVGHLEDSIARGTVRLADPLESRNGHQSVTLLEAIEEHRFDLPDRRRAARRREGARQGAHLQPPRQLRPMAAQGAAPGAVDAVQHAHPPGRAFPRLPDQQLDRARRVAVHRARADPAARACTTRTSAKSCAAAACWCR